MSLLNHLLASSKTQTKIMPCCSQNDQLADIQNWLKSNMSKWKVRQWSFSGFKLTSLRKHVPCTPSRFLPDTLGYVRLHIVHEFQRRSDTHLLILLDNQTSDVQPFVKTKFWVNFSWNFSIGMLISAHCLNKLKANAMHSWRIMKNKTAGCSHIRSTAQPLSDLAGQKPCRNYAHRKLVS